MKPDMNFLEYLKTYHNQSPKKKKNKRQELKNITYFANSSSRSVWRPINLLY